MSLEPPCVAGPEIDIIFSGGACLLNETDFLAGNGSLAVDCIAPSVTIDILPASLTSKYTSAVEFTDKVRFCKRQKGQRWKRKDGMGMKGGLLILVEREK